MDNQIIFREVNPNMVVGFINQYIRAVILFNELDDWGILSIIPKEYIVADQFDNFCSEIESKLDELNEQIVRNTTGIDASKLIGNISKGMFYVMENAAFSKESTCGYEELCKSFIDICDAISYAKNMSKYFAKRDPLMWAKYEKLLNIASDIKKGD